ncbi:MAG: hypothetical protein AAGB13_17560 [Cyanobacteria bacterium P01_F01_bin.33]
MVQLLDSVPLRRQWCRIEELMVAIESGKRSREQNIGDRFLDYFPTSKLMRLR